MDQYDEIDSSCACIFVLLVDALSMLLNLIKNYIIVVLLIITKTYRNVDADNGARHLSSCCFVDD